jgi:20S proteasome alpha/beta subunit
MTICVGTICENGGAAVVAADKMVTFGPPMSLQTEPPTLKKITKITDESVFLFSGSVPDGEEILSAVFSRIGKGQRQPIVEIAEAVKIAYIGLKRKRVEETILKPFLGADFAQFQTLAAQSAASQILQQVIGMIVQHNLQSEALIAGIDDSGSHLFIVGHPGILIPLDTSGYAAIGSGALHAAVRLSLAQHTKVASLVDTVYNVYEAKKAAEVSPGVGNKFTDLAVIKAGKVIFAKQAIFDALEKAHKEKPSLTVEEQQELKKVCDEWIESESKP